MRRLTLLAILLAFMPAATAAGTPSGGVTCSGPQVKLLDTSNGYGVSNGGKPPSFSTGAKSYCLLSITTYHWNNGKGAKPGTLGLTGTSTVGPVKATGSSGQGGAPNVNWTATFSTAKPVVLSGTYSCKDSDPATWSSDQASHGTGFCIVYAQLASGVAAPAKPTYTCSGNQATVFTNTNGFGVSNGGKQPSFTTKGKAYCVTQIVTYHWNGGHGAKPGTIGLAGSTTVGPLKATGSSGQGGAPNVNWTADVSTSKPVVIDGTYSCTDSNAATWSQDQASGGNGFCVVFGVPAVASSGSTGSTGKPGTTVTTKVGAPTISGSGKGGKLSITAKPVSGAPPLAVTFALSAPKVVQWRVDFGDGQSKVAIGQPPATLAHTYKVAGNYTARLTVISSQTATSSSSATANVSVAAAPLISLKASPASGNPPLKVTFALQTSATNITSWALDYGDGAQTSGVGKPPASLGHTYAKANVYKATFSIKSGAYSVIAAFAQVTVGGGAPPTLSLNAAPTSGKHPLTVTFKMTTAIPGQIASWQLVFGDGFKTGGSGAPPASVSHTYTKAGTYSAYLVVAQQQQYGGVQFIVPRNGLPVAVS